MKTGKVNGSGITYSNNVLLKANRFRTEIGMVQRLALGSDIFIFGNPDLLFLDYGLEKVTLLFSASVLM